MRHWETVILDEVTEKVGSGATPRGGADSYKPSGIPLIRSQNVRFEGFEREGLVYLDADQARALDNVTVRGGDVLLNITGASIGRVSQAPSDLDGARVNQHVCIIRPREYVNNQFLAGFLSSPNMQRLIFENESGATRQALTKEKILNFKVPLPSLNEQRRIVAHIEELTARSRSAREALRAIPPLLERFRQSVLAAAFRGDLTADWRRRNSDAEPASKLLERIRTERKRRWAESGARGKYTEAEPVDARGLPELATGWCWATLGEIASVQGGIQKQPSRQPINNAYPFLRVANVQADKLLLEEVHKIELFNGELEKLRLVRGDLLIVEGNGSPNEIGRMAIWDGSIQDCVHQNHLIRARLARDVSSEFVKNYWNSPAGKAKVFRQAKTTTGLYTLSVSKISSLPIPLAPPGEQEALAFTVDSMLAQSKIAVKAMFSALDRIDQSILAKAFRGELVPQDPTDEPASILLARLRAENAQQIPTPTRRKRG